MPWVDTLIGASARVGSATLRALAYVAGLSRVIAGAARHAAATPFRRFRPAIHQAMLVGVRALPILSLIVFFIGVIMALQSAHELRQLGAVELVASGVAIGLTRELGPFMTAMVVLGRSGSAFAAEIGTMKVNQELDALETMAVDPVRYLVTPKLVAMILMFPCLTIWANLMGVLGGALFGVTSAGFTLQTYMQSSLDALYLRDVASGLVKSVMFAVAITAVGCYEGFSTGSGGEAVGRSTTASVVNSMFAVILVDLVFTALFYYTQG